MWVEPLFYTQVGPNFLYLQKKNLFFNIIYQKPQKTENLKEFEIDIYKNNH